MEDVINKRVLSLGFIGGSSESAVGHCHQISSQMDNRWVLKAACFSRDSSINSKTASLWGVNNSRLYGEWVKLLQREKGKLDAIVILLPTPLHYEIAKMALELGYSVICEKAVAATSLEISLLSKLAKEVGGFFAVTYNYSGYPMLRELKHHIKSGGLGKIHQVQIEMPQEGYLRVDANNQIPQPQSWRLKDKKVPILSLDLGVHLHHLVHFLTEEVPLEIVCSQSNSGWFDNVIDNVNCLIRYSNKLNCNMWYSKVALGNRNGLKLQIYGELGGAIWDQSNPEKLIVSYADGSVKHLDRGGDVTIANQLRYNRFKPGHPDGFIEAFANLYCDIADALLLHVSETETKNEYVFGAEHALEGIKLFEAGVASMYSRKWETI
jgi:predicted dehydrogenase